MADPSLAATPPPAPASTAEVLISQLLRYGVLLATVVMSGGILFRLWRGAAGEPELKAFLAQLGSGELLAERSPLACWTDGGGGRCWLKPDSLTTLGLALLLALPIVRVAMTGVVFAVKRDLAYTVISAVVLALLLLGLWYGAEL